MFKSVTGDLEAGARLVLSLSHYNDYGNYQVSEIAMQDFLCCVYFQSIHTVEIYSISQ